MKKIAIATIVSQNYGNRLQNYALQSVLQNLGYNVTTLKRQGLDWSYKYKLKNYDSNDLIQIGNISIITAINKYDLSKGNEHIDSYIINTIKNAFRNLARSEIKYTSESSLNITVDEDNEIEALLSDSLDLEEYIINSMMHDLLKTILATLSHDEHELIRIAYFTPNTTLYRYCLDNNLNYPKKRRELIALIDKLRKLIEV